MDLATIIGMLVGAGVIGYAIYLGGSFMAFVDMPSILIVIGGGLAATLIRFPLAGIGRALLIGCKVAFTQGKVESRDVIARIVTMSETVRRSGPLGLDGFEDEDANLRKGAQFIADGYESTFIREAMELSRDLYLGRLTEGQRVFKALGDSAPAFGMIGTLVGLVQMLGNMEDPSTIGPAMAVALLTTLYGAVLANLVCLPIAEKLAARLIEEEIAQTLIIDGVLLVREQVSPSVVREKLVAYLPDQQGRQALAEAA
ncbi:chemotaxis protein MotA [Devosia enhydra]|uniref:Chemotaxis protein MotA n=1 Tax=Devosia enhydra TaxID=665118 RepID=A0A1K2I344_9HYPH|nr:MotA/TolQ/ExbB proton channel family protein [Devosia enhydra]SFZ86647.1 chemotaxis protein MotA [Devosia enhydra]